ncbi:MAG: hypothetical protein ACD_44C00110G0004 [uncultured bacterium]|nr:MAG: hypothetical protein ACD_44C00110G0004 [uncultured bacterium]OGT15608.1 MAG: hypothetical protein A3B69_03510 [Gammaproteobacteria bacterium RIFCSPHIGHO2_02_FULL_38_33]OGT68312.1 MAG: hypothetical protein A3I12_06710 [Gammaproteobacteria bacterium RIFCSPLOWO2_02_FULL_38_11]OGT77517.1 MAG: hypothetical protein A3G71_00585 [Gammaproteobacteria bacterium RIFCSPLOWO2_12_FULL_38_14]
MPISLGLLLMVLSITFLFNPHTRRAVIYLDNLSYDIQLRLATLVHHTPKKDTSIAIVDIDDQSLAAEGHWPWPRTTLATLVKKVLDQGAVVIAFDILFTESQPNPVDTLLKGLEKQKKLTPLLQTTLEENKDYFNDDVYFAKELSPQTSVLSFVFKQDNETSGSLPPSSLQLTPEQTKALGLITAEGYLSPISKLLTSAKNIGFINIFPDEDGITRRAPLIMAYHGDVYPSLALEATSLYLNKKINLITENYGDIKQLEGIQFGENIIPTDDKGQILIPFISYAYTFPFYSATDLLHDRLPPETLLGKIVFVGSSATALGDRLATSIQSVFPGVEVQATIADGILQNRFSCKPPWALGFDIISLFVLGILSAVIFPYLGARTLCLLILTLPVIFTLAANTLWKTTGFVISFLLPTLLPLSIAILNTIYGYLFETRSRQHLKRMFGHYVPSSHIDEMLKSSDDKNYGMHGETREMSVLFADIRNFTKVSERMSATELKEMLNLFFTAMTKIIFVHHGTIDKYIGDMIMAFWGAPIKTVHHAEYAITTALAMQRITTKLQTTFKEKGWPEIHIGIGINTGSMNVGDMGSKFRLNYTVLGDAVNLASRAESLTKFYGSKIIVTANTKHDQTKFIFQQLDCVRVKGKQQGIAIFEPLCTQEKLTPKLKEELQLHEKALQFYFKSDWLSAKTIFEKLNASHPHKKLYEIYLQRLAGYEKEPPANWDGVYVHTSK